MHSISYYISLCMMFSAKHLRIATVKRRKRKNDSTHGNSSSRGPITMKLPGMLMKVIDVHYCGACFVLDIV